MTIQGEKLYIVSRIYDIPMDGWMDGGTDRQKDRQIDQDRSHCGRKVLSIFTTTEEEDQKIMLLCRVALGGVKMLPQGQDRTADRYAEDPNIDSGWPGMGGPLGNPMEKYFR